MAHDIRPTAGELSEARSVIDVTLDASERELGDMPSPIHVGVGWADDPSIADAFGGAIATCHGPERITVRFTATDGWTDAVMRATARGVGRAWLQARLPDQRLAFRWQLVLAEAAGIGLADRVAPAVDAPWAPRETLAEEWPDMVDTLGEAVDAEPPLPGHDRPAFPLASLGVQLAEAVSLEDLPDMTRSAVDAALAARFDDA